MRITVKFSGNEISKSYDDNSVVTTSAVLGDKNLQGALGFGSNVEAQIFGTTLANDAILKDGDVLTVVTKANQKAA